MYVCMYVYIYIYIYIHMYIHLSLYIKHIYIYMYMTAALAVCRKRSGNLPQANAGRISFYNWESGISGEYIHIYIYIYIYICSRIWDVVRPDWPDDRTITANLSFRKCKKEKGSQWPTQSFIGTGWMGSHLNGYLVLQGNIHFRTA